MTGADFLWFKALSELKPCNDSRYSRLGTQNLGQALRRSLHMTACLSSGVEVELVMASGKRSRHETVKMKSKSHASFD